MAGHKAIAPSRDLCFMAFKIANPAPTQIENMIKEGISEFSKKQNRLKYKNKSPSPKPPFEIHLRSKNTRLKMSPMARNLISIYKNINL